MFATPGDLYSLDRVAKLKMPAIKISSGLLTNLPLIKEASKKKAKIVCLPELFLSYYFCGSGVFNAKKKT